MGRFYEYPLPNTITGDEKIVLQQTTTTRSVDLDSVIRDLGLLTGNNSSLDSLLDVVITDPNIGQVIKYDGNKWINSIEDSLTLASLTDTEVSSVSEGDVLRYDASLNKWVGSRIGSVVYEPAGFYDIACSVDGTLDPNVDIMRFISVRNFYIPIYFIDSQASCEVAPLTNVVLSVRKNGNEFGTITFFSGTTTGVFYNMEDTYITVRDVLTVTSPNPVDPNISDIQITIVGVFADIV